MKNVDGDEPGINGRVELHAQEMEFNARLPPLSLIEPLMDELLKHTHYGSGGMMEAFARQIGRRMWLSGDSRLGQVLAERAQTITTKDAIEHAILEGLWDGVLRGDETRSPHEMVWALRRLAVRQLYRDLALDAPRRNCEAIKPDERPDGHENPDAALHREPDALEQLVQTEQIAEERRTIESVRRLLHRARQQRRYLDAYEDVLELPRPERHRAVCQQLRITGQAGRSLVREIRRKVRKAGITWDF